MLRHLVLPATIVVAIVSFRSLAQDKSADPISASDKLFLKGAACGSDFEVQAGEAALKQSQNNDIKQLAQKIIDDHKQASQQIKSIASQKGVDVPADLPQEKKECLQVLQSLSGRDFDEEYICVLKADHAKDVSKFDDKSKLSKDNDVKKLAGDLLPKLRDHRDQIVSIAQAQFGLSTDEARTAGSRIEGTPSTPANQGAGAPAGSKSQ